MTIRAARILSLAMLISLPALAADTSATAPLLLEPVPMPRDGSPRDGSPREIELVLPTPRTEPRAVPVLREPVPTIRGDVRPAPSTPTIPPAAVTPEASAASSASSASSAEANPPAHFAPISPAPSGATVEPAPPSTSPIPVMRASANDVARIRSLFNAMRFFDRADYARAETLAIEVLLAHPADTVALTIAGAARLKQNNALGAIEIFTAYVERYPLEGIAHFYLGLAHHQGGDRAKAVEAYWTAVLLDPSLEAARANLEQLRAP